jgi:hypothetical protein
MPELIFISLFVTVLILYKVYRISKKKKRWKQNKSI